MMKFTLGLVAGVALVAGIQAVASPDPHSDAAIAAAVGTRPVAMNLTVYGGLLPGPHSVVANVKIVAAADQPKACDRMALCLK